MPLDSVFVAMHDPAVPWEANIPYRDLFEAHPEPMWLFDLETRRFLMVNEAAVRRYGWTREQFREMRIDDLRPPGEVEKLDRYLSDMNAVADTSLWVHRTRDGDLIEVEVASQGVEVDDRPARLVQVHDVTAKRAAEQERRLLNHAVLAAANAVVITDADGVIQWVNPAFTRITGHSLVGTVGRKPGDLLRSGNHSSEFYRGLWETILAGEVWRGRMVNRRRNGSRYIADQTITPVKDTEGRITHFISVHEDVTLRVEAEEELAKRVRELRVLYRATRIVHGADTPFDDRLRAVIEVIAEDFAHPERTEVRLQIGGFSVSTPNFARSSRRMTSDVRVRGVSVGQLELGGVQEPSSVDEPVQEENRRLLDSLAGMVADAMETQRLTVVSREMTDVIYTLEADGTVQFATASIEAATGYPRQEFEGSNALSLVHEDDRQRATEALARLQEHPDASSRAEYRIVDREGRVRHVESVGRNLLNHPGVRGILVTTRDVTERVELHARAKEGQRLESIGRLAAGIAHDFNNLLTVIRSQMHLLLADLDPGNPAHDDLEVVRKAADRAAALTAQLLAFSRDQVLHPRVVALDDVVEQTLGLVRRVIGEDIRIELDRGDGTAAIEVDPAGLEQVVLNLAVNARDAMPSGGLLRIVIGEQTLRRPQHAGWADLASGRYVSLKVMDTGVGMDEETRVRVFEPFFTTKGRGSGTGLGLASAYGFMKQSGGGIRVESEPGKGTTFHLLFPAADGVAKVKETSRPAPSGAPVDMTGVVMVVEDDSAVRSVVERILRREGLDVVVKGDAETALAALEEGLKVDLLLSDLGLPGMGGRQLSDMLQSKRPELPVILMSGYESGRGASGGGGSTTRPFLQKPFDPETLAEAVREALSRRGVG